MKTKIFKLARDLKKIPSIVHKMDDSEVRECLKFFNAKMGRGHKAIMERKLLLIGHLQNTHCRIY